MNRRTFLKFILGIPVLGALALFASPLVRYLRPSLGPITATKVNTKGADPLKDWQGESGLATPADMPMREKNIEFDISQFPSVWSYQTFTFGQKSKEYTFQHFQSTKIPGYAVRLPDKDGQPEFMVVSRICPHMGCVFNFLDDPKAVSAYNYNAENPMFACPCHLSVYDPLQTQNVAGKDFKGKVVSGPAPRPPRKFDFKMEGTKLIITNAESGGIS